MSSPAPFGGVGAIRAPVANPATIKAPVVALIGRKGLVLWWKRVPRCRNKRRFTFQLPRVIPLHVPAALKHLPSFRLSHVVTIGRFAQGHGGSGRRPAPPCWNAGNVISRGSPLGLRRREVCSPGAAANVVIHAASFEQLLNAPGAINALPTQLCPEPRGNGAPPEFEIHEKDTSLLGTPRASLGQDRGLHCCSREDHPVVAGRRALGALEAIPTIATSKQHILGAERAAQSDHTSLCGLP